MSRAQVHKSRDSSMDDAARPQPVESRAGKTLREIFQSGRPLTYIRSSEEQRVGRVLREVGRALIRPRRCRSGPGASPRDCFAKTAKQNPALSILAKLWTSSPTTRTPPFSI